MIYFLNVGNKDSVVTSTANDNELLNAEDSDFRYQSKIFLERAHYFYYYIILNY